MTANAPTAAKSSKPARTLRLHTWSKNDASGVLTITQGKKFDVYVLTEVESGYAERAYTLGKVDESGRECERYAVSIEAAGDTCTCAGGSYVGRCKHASAVRKLLSLGSI